MKIAILGTGLVGRTLGGKLAELGHEVMLGTRDVEKTLANTEADYWGNPPISAWLEQLPQIALGTFADAAAHGEVIFNCVSGAGTLAALQMAGEANLNGKILIDVANPLDASQGMPPVLSVSNTDSLGEQIQRALPQVKVVKSLNTMNAGLMINPALLPEAHDVFVSGNDAAAKAQVAQYLKEWFGWQSVIDLGDITSARGAEMIMPMWLRLFAALQTSMFNFKIVQR